MDIPEQTKAIDLLREAWDDERITFSDGGHSHRCAFCEAFVPIKDSDHDDDCLGLRIRDFLKEME